MLVVPYWTSRLQDEIDWRVKNGRISVSWTNQVSVLGALDREAVVRSAADATGDSC